MEKEIIAEEGEKASDSTEDQSNTNTITVVEAAADKNKPDVVAAIDDKQVRGKIWENYLFSYYFYPLFQGFS